MKIRDVFLFAHAVTTNANQLPTRVASYVTNSCAVMSRDGTLFGPTIIASLISYVTSGLKVPFHRSYRSKQTRPTKLS